MAFTPNLSTTLLLLTVIVVLLPVETYAFGAGDIPDFAYLNDKAFRHGDIESILETLVKNAGGVAAGGGLLGFASSMLKQATGGARFTKSDIKKVYFAMDIAGLSKLTADTLVLVVSVLGFMTFGFATEEYQVTADRLGVYLPVEHIDNPKGYAAKEGDAREFHPKLRPPVDDRELEIDERTGMKNYMATENQGWDTSTAFIRRTLRACIEHGRRAGGQEGAELWEAYRLLGTGLHTMEDLLAHSNWCEVALRKLGHQEVFCHVGDDVLVDTPNGPAPPLVTGTFGGADFIFSLMGEATDKLSQASVTDLSQKMSAASGDDNQGNIANLKNILSQLPIGGGDDKVNQGEEMSAQAKAYEFNPDDVAPPEVQQQLLDLLKWRDQVYRDVVAKIEMVPGLTELLDELTNALNAYVYTVISPYVVPILQQATGVLGEGSKAVIDSEDQYEVFNNSNASDPSHSMLSKDHFDLILNEPAGKIAQIVVQNSVNLIVQAWADDSDADQVINQILEAFHHPYYADGRSNIQRQMFDHMNQWIGGLGHQGAQEIIQRLTKDSVRNGQNKRPGSENESHDEVGYGGHSHGGHSHGGSTYRPAVGGGGGYQSQQTQQSQHGQGSYGGGRTDSSNRYGQEDNSRSSNQYGAGDPYGAGNQRTSENQYGSGNQYGSTNTYGSGRTNQEEGGYGSKPSRNEYSSSNTYGQSEPQRYGQGETEHGSRRHDDEHSRDNRGESRYGQTESGNTYGGNQARTTYGESQREETYGSRRSDNEHSSGRTQGYGQDNTSYSQPQRDTYGSSEGRRGYGETQQEGYGSKRHEHDRRRDDDDDSDDNKKRRSREEHSRHEGGGYAPSYSQPSNAYQSSGGGEYGSSGYGGGRSKEQAYGGERAYGRGGNDETFGAERLRVNDSDDDDDDKKRRRHRKRNSD
ncbi:Het-C-domain-containing protein [Lyophyllum atratum]|nr:Het-C-domain-containing protein [Lyophyllum atratum]